MPWNALAFVVNFASDCSKVEKEYIRQHTLLTKLENRVQKDWMKVRNGKEVIMCNKTNGLHV